jgi:glutaredoxin 3
MTMPNITMYSTKHCPFCVRAERLLTQLGVAHINKIMIDQDSKQRDIMIEKTGRRTVPQIFIDDIHVGGFDDLSTLHHSGKLLDMLGITEHK